MPLAPSVIAPAYLTVPTSATGSLGDEAADLAQQLDQMVGEEERIALRALMPTRDDGRWAGMSSAIVCGRRNIKSWAIEMSVIHDAFVSKVDRVVWSAHLFATSQESFQHLHGLVENYDWLRRRVRRVRLANGEEGFDLVGGARIDFVARQSGKSGRGQDVDTLILDEWLFGTPAMLGAMIPMLGAVANPHVRYGSSPGMPQSGPLRAIRNRGRGGDDPTLSYVEWTTDRQPCADPDCYHRPKSVGCILDREDLWALANPAIGRRISYEFVRNERNEMPPDEFMRERLGWWEDPPGEGEETLFPVDDWSECMDEDSTIPDGAHLVFAVDVSWDRSRAHVAVAGFREDGLRHVQVVATMDPQDVKDWLAARIRRFAPLAIAVQGSSSPASSLAPDLDKLGIPVHAITGSDISKACGAMYDSIKAHRIRHLGQADLEQAVSTAVARSLGDGWAIDRKKSPTDVSGLVAVVEAAWVLDQLVGSASYDVADSVY